MPGTLDPLMRQIDDRLDRLRALGYLRDWRLWNDLNADRVLLEVTLFNGGIRNYALSALEVMQEAGHDLWWTHVERDIIYYCDRFAGSIGNQQEYQSAVMAQQYADFGLYRQQTPAFNQQMQEAAMGLRQYQDIFNWGLECAPPNEAAEKRAVELFLMACGKEAFDTLKSGKPLPITGSQGTKYTLHKRAAYCVERVSDNAKLCAVVPGVRLWDHLLGIKLMIEHDEPKFLETANVSSCSITDEYGNRFLNQERYGHAIRYAGGLLGGLGNTLGGVLGSIVI